MWLGTCGASRLVSTKVGQWPKWPPENVLKTNQRFSKSEHGMKEYMIVCTQD